MMRKSAEKKSKFSFILDNFLIFISTMCLSGIVIINLVNIAFRFLLNSPLFWSIELSSILAVWFSFIVLGINYKEDQNFKIDMLVGNFKGKQKTLYEIFSDLVQIIILGFILYSGFFSFFRNYRMTLPATEVSVSLTLYLPLIIGSITYVFFIIMKYLKKIPKRSSL